MISIFFYDYADWLYILEKTPTILWFNYPSMSRISEPFDLIWWESRIFRTCLRTNFQAIWPRYHFPSNIIYFTIGLAMLFIEKWYTPTMNCWLIRISAKFFLLENIGISLRLGAQSVTLLSTLRDPTQLRQHPCAFRKKPLLFVPM